YHLPLSYHIPLSPTTFPSLLPPSPHSYHLPLSPTTSPSLLPHSPLSYHCSPLGASTSCACRSRSCSSPVPQCGGSNCKGPTIQVANCSRYCRERRQGSYSILLIIHGGGSSGPPLLRQPGGTRWSPWETWSTCSQECAKGFRTRKRTCASAEGKSSPSACSGSPVEYQDCNSQPCPGNTPTTPHNPASPPLHNYCCCFRNTKTVHYKSQSGSDGHHLKACSTANMTSNSENLVCVCPVKGAWSCWASWSHCSATCGGGHYQRTRTCSNPVPANGGDICIGLHTEEALCNTHTCEGMQNEQIHR
uniref:Uncharacterized protein n=1 Tax=Hucho hucho TaxID=62062 RepID=A0A4W5LY97_9TELE